MKCDLENQKVSMKWKNSVGREREKRKSGENVLIDVTKASTSDIRDSQGV